MSKSAEQIVTDLESVRSGFGAAASPEPVLTVRDLDIVYEVAEPVHAVRRASLTLHRGEILGLAGESGSGKTTLAYGLNQLHRPPARIIGGSVTFHGQSDGDVDVLALEGESLRTFRWSRIAMVFQGAMNSLNPVISVKAQLEDVFTTHRPKMDAAERRHRSEELLRLVGVDPSRITAFAHELSGGMRQRVMIAIALACNPGLIIADEPTTALDVTIQAQILDLLVELKEKINSSIMLITHDLGVVAGMADYVVVMYAGRVVEKGTADDIFHHPAHPYTIGLMRSKPVVGKKVDELYNITGAVPNPVDMPNYCYFRDRCDMRCDKCEGKYPPEIRISDTHVVSCYRFFDTGEVLGYPKSVNVEEL